MNTGSSASNKPADMQSKPGKKRTGLWFALILVLIVLGALGYGAYYADTWLKNRDAQTQAQLNTTPSPRDAIACAKSLAPSMPSALDTKISLAP